MPNDIFSYDDAAESLGNELDVSIQSSAIPTEFSYDDAVEDLGDGLDIPSKDALAIPTVNNPETAMRVTIDDDAETAAKSRDLTGKVGLPEQTIRNNLSDVQNMVDLETVRALTKDSPVIKRALSDPDIARIVTFDSVEFLANMEGGFNASINAFKRQGLKITQISEKFQAGASIQAAEDTKRSFAEILKDDAENSIVAGSLAVSVKRWLVSRIFDEKGLREDARKGFEEVGRTRKEMSLIPKSDAATRSLDAILASETFEETFKAVLRDIPGATALSLELLLEQSASVAAGIGVGIVAGPSTGAVTLGALSGIQERYLSPADFLQKNGIDLTDPESLERFLNQPELLVEAQNFGFTRGMIIGAFDALSGGVAGQTIGGPLTNILSQFLVQVSLAGAGELSAELVTEGTITPSQVVLEMLGQVATVPLDVAAFGDTQIRQYFSDSRRAKEALEAHEIRRETYESEMESPLNQRSPSLAASLRAEVLKDQGIESVAVDAVQFNQFFQAELENDPDLAQKLGIDPGDIQEAIARGGEIHLTPEGYSNLYGLNNYMEIDSYVRLNEGDMSKADADEFQQSGVRDNLEAAESIIAGLETESLLDAEQISSETEQMLIGAGRSSLEAKKSSILSAARYVQRARDSEGQATALELFRADNMAILGPGQSFDPSTGQERVQPTSEEVVVSNLDKAEEIINANDFSIKSGFSLARRLGIGKAEGRAILNQLAQQGRSVRQSGHGFIRIPKPGTDLLSQLFSIGGIRDFGGELTNRDLQNENRPGFGSLVQETGLDEGALTEFLHEQGFTVDEVGLSEAVELVERAVTDKVLPIDQVEEFTQEAIEAVENTQIAEEVERLGPIMQTARILGVPEDRITFELADEAEFLISSEGLTEVKAIEKAIQLEEDLAQQALSEEGFVGGPEFQEDIQDGKLESVDINSPEFKNWFGDSKIVDDSGNPLIVFHGTYMDFDAFRPNEKRGGFIYVAEDSKFASNYASGNSEFIVLKKFFLDDNPDVFGSDGIIDADKLHSKAEQLSDNDLDFVIGDTPEATLDNFSSIDINPGGRIVPVYVKAVNPHPPIKWKKAESLGSNYFIEKGFDSVRIIDDLETETLAVFEPNQIKSAISNTGSFSKTDPNIFMQDNRASIQFTDQATIIRLGEKADFSSFLHEFGGHLFLNQLIQDQAQFKTEKLTKDLDTVQRWWGENSEGLKAEALKMASATVKAAKREANKKNIIPEIQFLAAENLHSAEQAVIELSGMSDAQVKNYIKENNLGDGRQFVGEPLSRVPTDYIAIAMHEQWARGAENYFRTGQAPSVELQGVFHRFKQWLTRIYKTTKNLIEFTPEVRKVMDRMLASEEEINLVEEQFNLTAFFDTAEQLGQTPAQFAEYQKSISKSSQEAKERQLKKHMKDVDRVSKEWWKEESAKIRNEIVEPDVWGRSVYRAMFGIAKGESPSGNKLDNPPGKLSREGVIGIFGESAEIRTLPKVRGEILVASTKDEGSHPDILAQNFYGYVDGEAMLNDLANAPAMETVIQQETESIMEERHGNMLENRDKALDEASDSVHHEKRGDLLVFELNQLEQINKVKPSFVKRLAKERISLRRVGEIKPSLFLNAEKKHGKEAGKLLRAGDKLGAAQAKLRQLLNFYMAHESYKVRAEIEKSRTYLNSFNKPKKKYKGIDANYVDKIKEVIEPFGFGPQLSARKRKALETEDFLDWVEAIQNDDGATLGINPIIYKADGETHFRGMTLDEFRVLHDYIKNIEAQGRLAKKVELEGEQFELDGMGAQISDRINKLPQLTRVSRANVFSEAAEAGKPVGKTKRLLLESKDKLYAGLSYIDAALSKVEFMTELMDGGPNGPTNRFIFQPYAAAEARNNDLSKKVTAMIVKSLESIPKKIRGKFTENIFVPLLRREYMRSELIMMALNTGTHSNFSKMVEGSKKDKDSVEGTPEMTEEGVLQAIDNLTEAEWDFVISVWKANESMYKDVEAVFRKENGISPVKLKPRIFTNKYGMKIIGGYIPMAYDSARSLQGKDIENKSVLESMQNVVTKASVFSGMTKERTGFSAPVDLNIERLPNHIARTTHFITHYEVNRSVTKLFRRNDVSRAIKNRVGPEYYDVIAHWIGTIAQNGQPINPTDMFGKVVNVARRNATIGILGASATTMSTQVLGLLASIDGLSKQVNGGRNLLSGLSWMRIGMVQYLRNPNQAINKVFSISGEMRHRLNNTDRDIRHALQNISGKKGSWKNMQRFSLKGIAAVQLYIVDMPTWLGGYNKGISEGMTDQEAAKSADSLVRMTQGAGGLKDLSTVQSTPGVQTMLTMFYSWFNVLYNILRGLGGSTKSLRDSPEVIARVLVLLVLPTAVDALMRGNEPDDDENYFVWLMAKSALFAASSVAILRDFTGIVEGFGYGISPIESFGDSLQKSVKNTSRAIDEGTLDVENLKDAVKVIGFGAGSPVLQVNRIIDEANNMLQGEDGDLIDFLRGQPRDKR